jgi:hypothetical protein
LRLQSNWTGEQLRLSEHLGLLLRSWLLWLLLLLNHADVLRSGWNEVLLQLL